MPTLLAEAASLVTSRSTTFAFDAGSDPSDPSGSSGPHAKAAMAGGILGLFAAVVLCAVLYHYLILRYKIHRPESKNFIFRKCCGEKRKRCGELEQNYQPYEMIRPQGQHHAEAGVNEGFENVAVSEAQRMVKSVMFERSR